MPRHRLLLILLVGLSLLLAGLVLADWLPALRGPVPETSEWYWQYGLRPVERWWLAVMAAVGLGLWGWAFIRTGELRGTQGNSGELKREEGRRGLGDWGIGIRLAGLVVASLAVQLALVYAHRPAVAAELVDRTLSNESNGYFTVAAETTNLNDLLRHFPERMPLFPSEHSRTHPPGLIVGQWLTIRAMAAVPGVADRVAGWVRPLRCIDLWFLEQPSATLAALAIWAFLPLLAGALTVVPVYGLARRLYGEEAGRLAAVLAAGLPALLVFAPTPDQLFALLAAGVLWAWLVALERRDGRLAFLAGALLSLATFLSLGNGVLALLVVALTVLRIPYSVKEDNTQYAIRNTLPLQNLKSLAWFLAGLTFFWLAYWIGWGVAPWQVAQVGLDQHYELVTSQRRYSWWVGYNLLDLLLFAGPVVIFGFVIGLVKECREWWGTQERGTQGNLVGFRGTQAGLAVALGLLLVLLDVSGTARGEVGRLWLFLMPLLVVVAAGNLVKRPTGSAVLLVAAQLLLALSIGLAWRPIEAVIVVAERPVMAETRPEQAADVLFGEAIRLVGYDLNETGLTAGGTLDFTLYWQAQGRVARPYTIFTHLINEDGTLLAQQDNWPVQGQWPPTCWQREETVVDGYSLVLPADIQPGHYRLLVGFYDAANGVRLVTAEGEDYIELTTMVVE